MSIKRSLKRRSLHQITVDNAEYDIEFYSASILKGEMHCSLIEEGTHVATQKKALKKCYQLNSRTGMLILLISFLVGGIAGYFAMTFALSSLLFSAN